MSKRNNKRSRKKTKKQELPKSEKKAKELTSEEVEKQKEMDLLRRIMLKREQEKQVGMLCMRKNDFENARIHFEEYLKFSAMDSPENVHYILHHLIICRLHLPNRKENLHRCVRDCDSLLARIPDDMRIHMAKVNALTRLLDWQGASEAIKTAVEQDQKENIPLLHTYLFYLNDQPSRTNPTSLSHKINWPVERLKLKKFYLSLTMPSRQNLLSFTVKQLHEAIDSQLCCDMLPPNCRPGVQQFIHKCLNYNVGHLTRGTIYEDNLRPQNKESVLYFLKQELGCLVSHTLWKHFELPEERPDPDKVKVEKFFQINDQPSQQTSVLAENGIYFANVCGDFVSAACIESISNMTHVLDVHKQENQSVAFFNINHLHDLGLELVMFLSENTQADYSFLTETDSFASRASDEEWDKYAGFRIMWHERLDIKAIETLTPPKDNEDPKLFEHKLEKVLGVDKTKELLKIEFDASKPILERYAEIISEISGLDKDVVLAELTDEEDWTSQKDENVSSEINENILKDKIKEKKYQPVGISLLVQTTNFDLIPSKTGENSYNKEKILTRLKNIEKSVIEFQINYKNQVFAEAGEKAEELKAVMSNISFKGLELTKWLRGFVHYMLERRDIEQQILDYAYTIYGYKKVESWSVWWENLGNSMCAGQSILLCLIHRLFVNNLVQSYLQYYDQERKEEKKGQEFPNYFETLPRFRPQAGARLLTTTENIQTVARANDISQPLMNELRNIKKALVQSEVLPTIEEWLNKTIDETEGLRDKIETFKEKLGLLKLTVPCVFLNQPVQLILKYLGRGINYHKELSDSPFSDNHALGEDIRCMCIMCDSASSSPETLFHLVYSSVDQKVLGFPTRRAMGAPTLYLCQHCDKRFGTLICQKCGVAHYCGKFCQIQRWKEHCTKCKAWRLLKERIQVLSI